MQTPRSHQDGSRTVFDWLRERHGTHARVNYATFVEAALYAPGVGYYRQERTRVARDGASDFYTAASLGGVFRELVLEAVTGLLPEPAAQYRWVELGAETPGGLLGRGAHPFAAREALGIGDAPRLEGPCVVFSNELFDAQPFRRYVVRAGRWHEAGVALNDAGLAPCDLGPADSTAGLPPPPQDGYQFDDPCGARALLGSLLAAPWHGLFVAFDYGLDRATLHQHRPEGTARTYHRHRLGTDLLAAPGDCDITHHVCWDDLVEALEAADFAASGPISQESFFMRRATETIARIVALGAQAGVHRDLQTLKELLHPENMGRKFQVLHALRRENACHEPTQN